MLKEMYKKFHDRGLAIVSISVDEDREKFERASRAAGFAWPQVFDAEGAKGLLVKLFNARGIPVSYLIGANGRIAAKVVNGAQLQQQITKLMEN